MFVKSVELLCEKAGLDLQKEMERLHKIMQLPVWKKWCRLVEPTSRLPLLARILPKPLAIWVTALLNCHLSAEEIEKGVKEWIGANGGEFDLTCVTALPPAIPFKEALEEKIKKKYPQATLFYKVNERLGGGLQLIFPTFMIDASLLGAFLRVKKLFRSAVG